MTPAEPSPTAVLSLRGISVNFGGLAALSDVNLDAHSGQVTGIIGPNGAGKTTLFNALSGFVVPASGSAMLDRVDLFSRRPSERARSGLGRTFQTPKLAMEMTAADNASAGVLVHHRPSVMFDMLVPAWTNSRRQRMLGEAREVLRRVDPTIPPDALVSTLTLAQRRMTEIARAVCSRPKALLLDEPFGGLHDTERDKMQTLVREIANDQIAVLIIEHDMRVVSNLCDEVTVLDFGQVISHGTPEEIAQDPEVISAYLGTPESQSS